MHLLHPARFVQALDGDLPRVETIGILSAENPDGVPRSPEDSRYHNHWLWMRIRDYEGYRQVRGTFGAMENPFVVNNVPRGAVIGLGDFFGQRTVIVGRRFHDGDDTEGLEFELLQIGGQAEPAEGESLCRMFRRREPVGVEGFHVEHQGRPFAVPFFGEGPRTDDIVQGARVASYRLAHLPGSVQEQVDAYLRADAVVRRTPWYGGFFNAVHYYGRREQRDRLQKAFVEAMGDWVPLPESLRWGIYRGPVWPKRYLP